MKGNIALFIAGIIVIVVCTAMLPDYKRCQEKHGKMVRGLFWVECITPNSGEPCADQP